MENYNDCTAENLGPWATKEDLEQFVELCDSVCDAYPDWSEEEVTAAVCASENYRANIAKLLTDAEPIDGDSDFAGEDDDE